MTMPFCGACHNRLTLCLVQPEAYDADRKQAHSCESFECDRCDDAPIVRLVDTSSEKYYEDPPLHAFVFRRERA